MKMFPGLAIRMTRIIPYEFRLRLPAAGTPWREAAFRSAASIINIAEKSEQCVESICKEDNCSSLLHVLIETWGGKNKGGKAAVVHPGLLAILKRLVQYPYIEKLDLEMSSTINTILEREEKRRRTAQMEEKRRMSKLSSLKN